LFNPSRDQVRIFFFDSWEKFGKQQPLSPLEVIAVDIIVAHPEYHHILNHREKYIDREYKPEAGEANPFLHLAMHLAIREQVSIDQPPGVRKAHVRLSQKFDSALDAEHAMIDCLGEMIWQSQRHGTAFDVPSYLACMARK
jgi:Domain of unknown function (DUF1841)